MGQAGGGAGGCWGSWHSWAGSARPSGAGMGRWLETGFRQTRVQPQTKGDWTSVSALATFTLIRVPLPPKDTLEDVFILPETLRLGVKKLSFFSRRGFWNTEKNMGLDIGRTD